MISWLWLVKQNTTLTFQIRESNDPPIPADSVKGFASPEDVDDFLFHHLNTSMGALLWDITYFDAPSPYRWDISYVIQSKDNQSQF